MDYTNNQRLLGYIYIVLAIMVLLLGFNKIYDEYMDMYREQCETVNTRVLYDITRSQGVKLSNQQMNYALDMLYQYRLGILNPTEVLKYLSPDNGVYLVLKDADGFDMYIYANSKLMPKVIKSVH